MPPTSDYSDMKYRPITLTGDLERFFVGVYDQVGFVALSSVHNTPIEAIDEADRKNLEEVAND